MRDINPRLIGLLILALLIFAMAGCSAVQREEIAWQTLHAVDVAQTLKIAGDDCYQESGFITRDIIGNNPNRQQVMGWAIGTAAAHAAVTFLLEKAEAPRWVRKGWQITTISATAHAVVNNHNEGLRVFGDNEPVKGCS